MYTHILYRDVTMARRATREGTGGPPLALPLCSPTDENYW